MRTNFASSIYFFAFLFLSCGGDSDPIDENNNSTPAGHDWIVSKTDLTGSDNPFPFAENPRLSSVSGVTGLNDDDTVVLVSFKEEIRAYPYRFISTYEVVNDVLDGKSYAITYCPVTESGICANNLNDENTFSLVASGFRYKDNLISFDENTNSYWSQMLLKCIKGKFENQFQKTLPMVETSWRIVKSYFPDARVFTPGSISEKNNTSKSKTSGDIGEDERVFGILKISAIESTGAFIYRQSDFNADITIYQKLISSKNTFTIGSTQFDFMVSYIDDSEITYTPVQQEFPVVMQDNTGSKWNVFGIAVSGPRKGEQLKNSTSYIASWWAWKDFYSDFTFAE